MRSFNGFLKTKKSMRLLFLMVVFLIFGTQFVWAQTISPQARIHFNQGLAAMEAASTPAGYEAAIRQFELAKSLAPEWAEVYYKVGVMHEEAGPIRGSLGKPQIVRAIGPHGL